MARHKLNKTEKLLREIKRKGGLTRKEMVEYLLGLDGDTYLTKKTARWCDIDDSSTYNSLIYGTKDRCGLADAFLTKRKDGKWALRRTRRALSMKGPFTAVRRVTDPLRLRTRSGDPRQSADVYSFDPSFDYAPLMGM